MYERGIISAKKDGSVLIFVKLICDGEPHDVHLYVLPIIAKLDVSAVFFGIPR